MANELIISKDEYETRIALLENNRLEEFYTERKSEVPKHGSIYKGKVMQVLPGIQASFIDIGWEKSAFLYAGDFYEINGESYDFSDGEGEEGPREENHNVAGEALLVEKGGRKKKKRRGGLQDISRLLKKGQEILVQIEKVPVKTKGARVTSHISLPGRFLVYTPTSRSIGISRKIRSDEEKKRLKRAVVKYGGKNSGFIIRTAAEGASEMDIERDIIFLTNLWNNIYKSQLNAKAPRLIFQDISLSQRVLRDLLNENIDKIYIDDREEFEMINEFLSIQSPEYRQRLELYEGDSPVFENFGVEKEIFKSLNKKVWLKSGGYIVIDHTEALTAVDVNTGKFVGKKNLEDTVLKTNLEAAKEIAHQLKLRNIGGIIVIDFIDMIKEINKEKVFKGLETALKSDRVKTTINKITELGLVEMTRKRTGNSLSATFLDQCPMCEGLGMIKSARTICFEIYRRVLAYSRNSKAKKITLKVHPTIMNKLYEEEDEIRVLEKKINKKLSIKMQDSFYPEYFEIS